MLKRNFDSNQPHRYVCYMRMSTNLQNPRSPEQQLDTINGIVERAGKHWVHVRDYEDRGISGQRVRSRPGFSKMLSDIYSRSIQIKLILVDTFERFGRAEEVGEIRRKLRQKFGVLVLTADTQFSDPTTVSGQAMAAFESLRSIEDGRIKGHNVLRGKRDAVKNKRWPGGRPPFGFTLKSVLVGQTGEEKFSHCCLVPDAATSWIIKKVFRVAHECSLGCTRIAKMLNSDPSIPSTYKPFRNSTVAEWLKNLIYRGDFLFGQFSSGIVDDRRIYERNEPEEMLYVEGYCEPLVSREVWDEVNELRSKRAAVIKMARRNTVSNRQSKTGIALTYPLSGLARCAVCNRSMGASSRETRMTSSGEIKVYVYYSCPGHVSGACTNGVFLLEDWLRESVLAIVRRRLFPIDSVVA